MANKALVTLRAGARPAAAAATDIGAARTMGVAVEHELAHGLLVRGTDAQYRALEAEGFRVKLLTDTNLLRIGRYTIDVESNAPPTVPAALDVSAADEPAWPHHLVQLGGPPVDEWVRAIEARGVDVVEPVSGYALFVCASGTAVTALRDLPFVVWTGSLKPAYRLSPDRDRAVEYLFVGVYPSGEASAVRGAIVAAGGRVLEEGANRPRTAANMRPSRSRTRRRKRWRASRTSAGSKPFHACNPVASAKRRSSRKTWMVPPPPTRHP